MEQVTNLFLTAVRVLGLDWERPWPKFLTEHQVCQLLAMGGESKDPNAFELDVMLWKARLREAEIECAVDPVLVPSVARVYSAEEFQKFLQWAGAEPNPYVQEWIESQIGPVASESDEGHPAESVAQRQDRWLREFRDMGGEARFIDKARDNLRTGFGKKGALAALTRKLQQAGEKGCYEHGDVAKALKSALKREEERIEAAKEEVYKDVIVETKGGIEIAESSGIAHPFDSRHLKNLCRM